MQDKLQILHHQNEVKYKYILFDKCFTSIANLVFIEEEKMENMLISQA